MPQAATQTPDTDWFAQNAPRAAAKSTSGGDWFEDNAPSSSKLVPGAFQQRPGGPILNTSTSFPSKYETENARPLATRALNEFTLGATSAISGLPETQHPVTDAAVSAITPPPLPRTPIDLLTSPYVNPAAALVRSIGERVYGVGKELLAPRGEHEAPEDALLRRAHATGTVAGTAAQFVGGKEAAEEVPADTRARMEPRNIAKGTKSYAQGLGLPNPPDVEGLAGKGASDNVNAARDIQIAQKDIAKIERESPARGQGSAATFSHARAIKDYMDTLWEDAHSGPIQRNVNAPINVDAVVQAGMKELTPEAVGSSPANTALARRVSAWVQTEFGKPRSLGSADQMLRELNADLEAPAAQRPFGPLGTRVQGAVRDQLREEINNALIREGEGSINSVNQRWGALRNILDRTIKAGESEAKAEGGKGVLPDWVRTYMFAHMTGIHAGVSVHPAEMFPATPSKSIVGGAQRLARTSLQPPPIDKTPLLPASTGPDTSGPIRRPIDTSTPEYELARQRSLPPSSNTPLPTPPGPAGFPPTRAVATTPEWEPTPRSATPAENLWNTNPTMARPGGLGGMRLMPPPSRTSEAAVGGASREAMTAVANDRTRGITRFRRDTRTGAETPLVGVDARDPYMGPHDEIGYRDANGNEHIVDRGVRATQTRQSPASGIVRQEFRTLGITNLLTPRQQTTLETMIRGPRWRGMAPDERIASIQSIVRGERF